MTKEDLLEWRKVAKDGSGHNLIANANSVLRFIACIEALERECEIRRTEHIETCKRVEALERENAAMAKVVEAARTVNRTCDELHIELAEAMVAYDRALAPATSKGPT